MCSASSRLSSPRGIFPDNSARTGTPWVESRPGAPLLLSPQVNFREKYVEAKRPGTDRCNCASRGYFSSRHLKSDRSSLSGNMSASPLQTSRSFLY